MATKFVRTPANGGSDSNSGTNASPWASVTFAYANAAAGDVVKVGPGTYEAATFLTINRALADWLEITSESGNASDVILQGADATYNCQVQNAATKARFRNITFGFKSPTQVAACRVIGGTDIDFLGCRFNIPSDPTGIRYGLQAAASGASVVTRLTVDQGAAVHSGSNSNTYGIYVDAGASAFGTIKVYNATAHGGLAGMAFIGAVSGIDVFRCDLRGTGIYGVRVGQDSNVSVGTLTGSIKESFISSRLGTSHGLMCGAGASNFLLDSLEVEGADYGVVIKENAGTILRNCPRLRGGTVSTVNGSAVYVKGATGALITGNALYSGGGIHGTFRLGAGDTGNKAGTTTLTGNAIASGGNTLGCLEWADSTGDSGGGVCDDNEYACNGAAALLGNVRAGTALATMAALRAAWSGYDVANNDSHSRRLSAATLAAIQAA